MVEELKKALEKAEKLPIEDQKLIAEMIMDEISWDEAVRSSERKLSSLAAEALQEYKRGKTKPLKF
jgi:hypothetical protein